MVAVQQVRGGKACTPKGERNEKQMSDSISRQDAVNTIKRYKHRLQGKGQTYGFLLEEFEHRIPSAEAVQGEWDAGFNLDDWDICIESDTRLLKRESDGYGCWWDEPVDEAYWLVRQMENYCCGYTEVEYNGKWYYTVHHA